MALRTKQILGRAAAVVLGMAVGGTALAQDNPAQDNPAQDNPARGNVEQGKAHFQLCVACHGPNAEGNQVLNAPATAGQHAWYISRQLKNFRTGLRGSDPADAMGAQMKGMAMALPDDQAIEDVAAYIETLPKANPAATVTGDAEAGKQAFAVCSACHGDNGQGDAQLSAPRLAGLADWYLTRQLQNFKGNIRGGHLSDVYGTQMRYMSQLLKTDKDIADVVTYIGTLSGAAPDAATPPAVVAEPPQEPAAAEAQPSAG